MNIIVSVGKFIGVGRGSKVALPVHVNIEALSHQGPHSDIKLPSFEEERPFHVLLSNPTSVLWPARDEPDDIVDVVEDLDSTTLVAGSRLDEPNVVGAVLHGDSLLHRVPLRDFLISLQEVRALRVIQTLRQQESCRSRIKYLVVGLSSSFILEVVLPEWPDQSGLSGQAPQVLKVVVDERDVRILHDPPIDPPVPIHVEVEGSPQKVTLLYGIRFPNLLPVSPILEAFPHCLWVVAPVNVEFILGGFDYLLVRGHPITLDCWVSLWVQKMTVLLILYL